MRRIGAALAIAAAGMALTVGSAPANAFPCTAEINPPTVGVTGVLTVQVCSEGVRTFPTGEVTTVNQVGVTVLGTEYCVGQGRIVVDLLPPFIPPQYDDGGVFGTPVFVTCPGT